MSEPSREELVRHEDDFNRLMRALLTDVAIGKLGVMSSRANDLLHKLKHLESLRAAKPERERVIETTLTLDDLLILLAEECSEVTKAATKALRFGWNVDHEVGYGNNRMVLSREVGDLLAIIDALPLDLINVDVTRSGKIAKAETAKAKYGRALKGTPA